MQQIETHIMQKFETKLLEFQKTIDKIAAKTSEPKDPLPKKKNPPTTANTHNTCNKALRAKYNPEMEVESTNSPMETEVLSQHHPTVASSASSIISHKADETANQASQAHVQIGLQDVNFCPAHKDEYRIPYTMMNMDKNKDMNQWVINWALMLQQAISTQRFAIICKRNAG